MENIAKAPFFTLTRWVKIWLLVVMISAMAGSILAVLASSLSLQILGIALKTLSLASVLISHYIILKKDSGFIEEKIQYLPELEKEKTIESIRQEFSLNKALAFFIVFVLFNGAFLLFDNLFPVPQAGFHLLSLPYMAMLFMITTGYIKLYELEKKYPKPKQIN